jgi:ribosomal protein L29
MKRKEFLKEMRQNSIENLKKNLQELYQKLYQLKIDNKLRKLKNYKEIKAVQKKIAQISTIIKEKESLEGGENA